MFRLPQPLSRAATARAATLLLFMLTVSAPRVAAAGPTVGLIETFSGAANLAGWTGGSVYSNPGTGGVGGAGDGYLQVANQAVSLRLGTHNLDPDYAGDYLAASADRIRFSLRDVGANQNPEIHFSIGNTSNFWQSNVGFLPPDGSWSEFTVDLNDSANFTQIVAVDGFGYRMALATCDRVHLRHDKSPFIQTPDGLTGEIGIDDFKIESSLVGVDPLRPGSGGRRAVMLASPAPNPSRGGTVFAFEAFDDGPVSLAIVDARGRMVRRATLEGAAPGRRAWSWDGRDDAGRAVAAGVYRVRATTAAGGGSSRAFVRLD